jgi:hypothetical protein
LGAGAELVAWLQDDRVVISTRRTVAARTRGMYSHLGEGAVDGLDRGATDRGSQGDLVIVGVELPNDDV